MNSRRTAQPPNRFWLVLLGVVVLGFGFLAVINWSGTPGEPPPQPTSAPVPTAHSVVPTPVQAPAAPTDVFIPAVAAPTAAPSTQTPPPERATATPTSQQNNLLVQRNVRVYALDGHLAYAGDVDLRPVFQRIADGQRDPHPNDGSVFTNVERRLPTQTDRSYYREYVVRTPDLREVGPQRLIIGKAGDAYYTSDHYAHFVRVK